MTDWLSQQLDHHHVTAEFRYGRGSLDGWLQSQALRAQTGGTARTYVWVRPESTAVKAYFAIAPTRVMRDEVPRSMSGGVTAIPAYLLARLALDESLHGQGLGSELLVNALSVIVSAAQTAAGRLIVVDAIDEAAEAFYRHHDFFPIAGERRLAMKVATARAALRG
jgi:GNAT superfamily N-acetyltransferase